jgi:hypothetical protein
VLVQLHTYLPVASKKKTQQTCFKTGMLRPQSENAAALSGGANGPEQMAEQLE